MFRSLHSVAVSISASTGIRAARVEDDHLCMVVIAQERLGPLNRCGFHAIAREDARSHVLWSIVDDEREVTLTRALQAGHYSGCAES